MEELLKAISLVLEWHDENLSDNVNREYAIRELRQAYDAAQQSAQRIGCTDCRAEVSEDDAYCPKCGLANPANRSRKPLGRHL